MNSKVNTNMKMHVNNEGYEVESSIHVFIVNDNDDACHIYTYCLLQGTV